MKKMIQWFLLAATLFAGTSHAGGSNPGLYYGQVPTAAQWNSYFSAKLDYTPGAANTIPYWDGSGSLLNAPISGDCTSSANMLTCNANNINGGTQWGVLYQSASGVTATTSAGSAGQVLTSNGAAAPTYQDIGNPFAAAIHAATSKTTPVGADEVGIWDSVSGLLNKVTFTNLLNYFAPKAGDAAQTFSVAAPTAATHAARLDQVSLMPTVASAATIDVFGAAGVTIDLTGTTTVTGLTACTTAQVGSKKTVIPSNAAGVSFTASANMTVDGATSGTYLMPQNAQVEILATSTTTFRVRTVYASGTWTPAYALTTPGTSSFGTYSAQTGYYTKIGSNVTLHWFLVSGTFTLGTGSGTLQVTGAPFPVSSSIAASGVLNNSLNFVTFAPVQARMTAGGTAIDFRNTSGATVTSITSANCASALRTEGIVEYIVTP